MIGYLFIYLSTYLALYGEKSSYYVGFVVAVVLPNNQAANKIPKNVPNSVLAVPY